MQFQLNMTWNNLIQGFPGQLETIQTLLDRSHIKLGTSNKLEVLTSVMAIKCLCLAFARIGQLPKVHSS